jgi:transposase-like protein
MTVDPNGSIRLRAVTRVLAGETAIDVAAELGLKAGTLRQWVARARKRTEPAPVVKLAPPPDPAPSPVAVDLGALSLEERIEHQITEATADIEAARADHSHGAITAQLKRRDELLDQLSAIRTARADEFDGGDPASIAETVVHIMRNREICHLVLADRVVAKHAREVL